ncbi:STE/STE11/CDC15 protein kinase [Microbotryum lychnidis-dioicae p1A1 Lamole]|uniref:non-specific serine/threonine protein kinase n=1 Tax=Microbotryum lychnidis-dioicae (strain p1A1 Lamole / MvSl-1064) TaxID=683840 RepID=U5H380_USTV1|nr:STE/STE11/CDC15 protein kinase [Microbotryum lychnidis-dioicae p1A1 Lamole]|eukprot:KDE07893.1 STE/STE11/CDC15 protein kinase [Microbotryum lychnidis-dioicae p1A1 Lamole]
MSRASPRHDATAPEGTQIEPLPNYKLGEKLGQGSFGSVYRALNWHTGETCAVKQIGLTNIPKAQLPDIMSEIDLLKNLHHPNIVQYRGFVKTNDSLYIILEYCENGSLHAVTKKFGRFPESLVGLYILQVLHGLMYLHEQGVIHRDIKGSNILATKEGSIKLADFGVATRAGGPSDSDVVGSPYWMAPEVVDQSGATTASDVWSLGALVIELVTGKPPYHFLDPMPALFRIVNDDCPPIPEGASPVVKDFLLQCFQKDANLRISAKKLLRHPWMLSAKRQVEQTRRDQSNEASTRPLSGYSESVQKVQEWNEAIKVDPHPYRPQQPRPSRPPADESHRRASVDLNSVLQTRPTPSVPTPLPMAQSLFVVAQPALRLPANRQEEPDDNWDNDFEDDISIAKIGLLDKESNPSSGRLPDTHDDDDEGGNSATLRPPSRPSLAVDVKAMPPIVEDYSDLVCDDEAAFEGRVLSLQAQIFSKKRILHPKDISDSVLNPQVLTPSSTPPGAERSASLKGTTRRPLAPLSNAVSSPAWSGSTARSDPTCYESSPVDATRRTMEKYSEVGSEDYSDLIGKGTGASENGITTAESLRLATRLSSKSWLGDVDSDEEDPFAEVDLANDIESGDFEANIARDKHARLCDVVSDLIDAISVEHDEVTLRELSLDLITILEESVEVRAHFTQAHGMLTAIELLRVTRSREVIAILLRVVNLVISSDPPILEKICLVGGCPVMMVFASNRYSRDIRLEAALFVGSVCRTSLLTLQMFISCCGLRTLVTMLMDESYEEGKDLVWMAVDGISRVFEMQFATPRTDFCRIFSQEGLLEPLSSALISVATDQDELAESARAKIVRIFLLFAQADHKIASAVAQRVVVLRLIKAVGLLSEQVDLLAILLKTIKHLTMIPSALEVLQNANAIEVLVRVLSRQMEGKLAAEVQNHVVNALFNLCRLSKARQEEAASAGAIPALKMLVAGSSPLKQFALPILCDFAHASKTCRRLLWRYDGLKLYVGLLHDPFWSIAAMDSILSWLLDEPARVEQCLLEPSAVQSLNHLFCTAKSTAFDAHLEPLNKILRTSTPLAAKLAAQHGFWKRIIDRLGRTSKTIARLNLLRLAKTAWEALSNDRPERERVATLLGPAVARLADHDQAILVKELAKELGKDLKKVRDGQLRGGVGLGVRKLRRTASDGAAMLFLSKAGAGLASTASSAGSNEVRSTPSTSSPRIPGAATPRSTSSGTPRSTSSGTPRTTSDHRRYSSLARRDSTSTRSPLP